MGKGVAVWILGSLTFLAGLQVLEAFFALTQNAPIALLKLYPFSYLSGTVNVAAYFLGSLIATFVLWGATCIIAFRNPLDMLLSRVLKDAQSENEEEVSLFSAKGNYLELMNEGLIRNTIEISNVKDLMQNVRAEVVSLRSLQDAVGRIRSDMTSLKTSLRKLETNLSRNVLCPACGKDVQSDFRICPYCGEDLLREKILLAEAEAIKAHK
ncbi:MAG TPA: zinc ribbon domain-containing protein [Candidatus Bathyarchaeia archaeon]|nr:zinc ribbon domain-containing protein [Candidatus Bathyarchaeia archaeon]